MGLAVAEMCWAAVVVLLVLVVVVVRQPCIDGHAALLVARDVVACAGGQLRWRR